jgi:hypothetical protein
LARALLSGSIVKLTVLVMIVGTACTSSDIVGTFGPATSNINGTPTAISAWMTPLYPDGDFDELSVGWVVGLGEVAVGSKCVDVTTQASTEINLSWSGTADETPMPIAAATYSVQPTGPTTRQVVATVFDASATLLMSGTVQITKSTQSELVGTFSADGADSNHAAEHIDGTFTANRCFY